jgi:hypothetical protein
MRPNESSLKIKPISLERYFRDLALAFRASLLVEACRFIVGGYEFSDSQHVSTRLIVSQPASHVNYL